MTRYNFDAIKAQTSIVAVIGNVVKLKRAGRNYTGCCPFHDERTPSFHVYPDQPDPHYHCFGCGSHGDVVDFVATIRGCDIAAAVDILGAGDMVFEGGAGPVSDEATQAALAQREAERQAAYQEGIGKAQARWEAAMPLPLPNPETGHTGHAYLERKGIKPRPNEVRIEGLNLLVPVYDAQGDIQSVQTISPEGDKLFQKGAPMKGGRLNIGVAVGRVIACEGYATGCSIFAAVPDQVRVCFSKDGMKDRVLELVEAGRDVVIAADRKGLADVLAFAQEHGVPVFVPSEPHDDFNDLEQAEGREAVAAILRGKPLVAKVEVAPPPPAPPAPANDDSDPVDVWHRNEPPTLPKGLLPSIVERFAFTRSRMLGGDPGGLAMSALAVCAAAIPDSISAKPKQHENWTENARLWVMTIGIPSTKKSPLMRAAASVIQKMDSTMFREYEGKLAEWQASRKDGPGAEEPKPLETRLRMDDITMESAQEVCRNSPDGVLALQDELSGWFGGIEKYAGGKGGAKDRSFWLRAYNGGEYAVNRIGRGSFLIENLSISILGGIQPDSIRDIMASATDDGLIQRFLPVVLPKGRLGVDEEMPDVAQEYEDLVRGLRQLKGPSNVFGSLPIVFDEDARAIREDMERKHFDMVISLEQISAKFASHIGKFDGMFIRLCLIWHCIENVNAEVLPKAITGATAQRVADFLHGFILDQSKAFYHGVVGVSDDQDVIEDVAGYILAHGCKTVTPSTFQRGSSRMKKQVRENMEPILQQLEAMGWLEEVATRGDKFTAKVRPRVHEMFARKAEEERERRAATVATIKKLVGKG